MNVLTSQTILLLTIKAKFNYRTKAQKILFLIIGFFILVNSAEAQDIKKQIKQNHGKKACAHTRIQHQSMEKNVKATGWSAYDLIYHRINWNIDPAVKAISGSVFSIFEAKQQLDTLTFDLHDNMTVDSVVYQQSAINYTHQNDKLFIQMPQTIAQGQKDSVTVYYYGSPGGNGFGSFMQSTHDNIPIIWTLSEPYGASEWWPCKNTLKDKIDSMDVFVHTQAQYKVASNGILVDETVNGQQKTVHWKHRYPITPYLVALAVTEYAEFADYAMLNSGDSIKILNYVYPEDSAVIRPQAAATVDVMELFNDLFMDYPFPEEKYGHAQFGWGGGMEHQTMSFMGTFNFGIVAHELAHQWFGNMVTLDNWPDIWLNEGFATYLTGLSYEHMFNGKYWDIWKENQIDQITSKPGGSVYCDDTTDVSRIFDSRLSYAKGAMVLHMLRWKIGDTAFYNGVRNYLNDPLLAYDYATTADLKYHLEQSSGANLDEFLNDWFYGEGYPSYSITWNQNSANEMVLKVDQTTSHSSVSFFEMPVQIKMKNSSQDTLVRLDHTHDGQTFTVNPGFTVDSVFFDPNNWIVSANDQVMVGVENPKENNIRVYPNPAQNMVNIEGQSEILKVEVFREDGIKMDEVNPQRNSYRYNINEFAKGVYFFRITFSKGVISRKIVKL
ncbi:MAG: M1 family aminopeptidase [Bacteroidota bacterium]